MATPIITNDDILELLNIVRGQPSDNLDDPTATGIRDLEGTGNNIANPEFGAADQPFIRLTDARYGDEILDGGTVINRALNPIFDGLDPREISELIGDQTDAPAPDANGANVFFNAFGQYFDHGLDFLTKGGNGAGADSVTIGAVDIPGPPNPNNPLDLSRGHVIGFETDGTPIYENKDSPFVDQNQAYGATELVGQFLRESDGNGGFGSHLFSGQDDPSNTNFKLLPTLGALVLHHWNAGSEFSDAAKFTGTKTLQDIYPDLVAADGVTIDPAILKMLNTDFMGSSYPLLIDISHTAALEDHFIAGDGRTNENISLTAIHNIWAREHNRLVDELEANGFLNAGGTMEELYQAAKIINVAQYQRVVFTEYADTLLGGLKGSGSHGFDDYNQNVNAAISHEFAGTAFRFGHSMLAENISLLDGAGGTTDISLVKAFLNPTNAAGPGFAEIGVASILGGIVTQVAEVVDQYLVDAVRDNLVRLPADLFSFNIARGRDLGLGTLNQIKADLQASTDPYVAEAIRRGVDGDELTPYTSWEDFQDRNELSDEVIDQFKAAYPDLDLTTLSAADRAAFDAANPGVADGNIVKGIDRVDFEVGGLAEKAVNGGLVGETFWVVLHEQFDRLQEGDRFYYLNQVDGFDFYDGIEDQTFADIVARNTGLTGLSADIFATSSTVPDIDGNPQDNPDDGNGDNPDDGNGDNPDDGNGDNPDDDGDDGGNGDNGDGSDDEVHGDDGDDYVYGGEGDDDVYGDAGDDYVFGNGGNDYVSGGDGDDYVYGDDYIPMDYNPANNGGGHHGGGCDTGCDTGHGGGGTYRCGKNEPKPEPKCDKPAPCDKDGYNNDYNGQYGLMGADVIYGGAGDDMMYGGGGADLFIFKSGEGYDTIVDFQPGYDEIKFEGDDKPFTVNYLSDGMEFDFGNGDGLKVNYADSNYGNGGGNGGGCQPCNPCSNQDNGDIWS